MPRTRRGNSPTSSSTSTRSSRYEPLDEQAAIDAAVGWVLVRPGIFLSTMQLGSRSSGSSGGIGYLSNAPATIALAELAAVGCLRWTIEEDFELAKGEVGLDHYDVTKFRGWYHHITLSLLALAFLKAVQREWGEKWSPGIRTGDPSAA